MGKKIYSLDNKFLSINDKVAIYDSPPREYLKFSAPETFSISVSTPGWDGTMEYSTDAKTWNAWDGLAVSGTAVYLRGTGNIRVTGGSSSSYKWTLTGSNIACEGNIETLLDYATVEADGHPTMSDYCYSYMFYNCTSLTVAPALPATTLVSNCYAYMFRGCTSLTTAPALPATTLVSNCYGGMFYNCSKIKLSETQTGTYTQAYRIPTSGAGTTAKNALKNMFYDTGGTFTGTPEINTTYYLDESCSII